MKKEKWAVFFLSIVFLLSSVSAQEFIRGDANNNGKVDLIDSVYILNYLFQSGDEPSCLKTADANDDGVVNLGDAIKVLVVLFQGGTMPQPYPNKGSDPTLDNLKCKDSCTTNNFKFAFVLLGRTQSEITQDKINKLNNLKSEFSTAFSQATSNLAVADVSSPVFTLVDNGDLLNSEKTEFIRDKVINKFFESHPDMFDFIVAFPTFQPPDGTSVNEDFTTAGYKIYGIGLDSGVSSTSRFNTKNFLGLAYIPRLETVGGVTNPYAANGILHEIGHNWCCYVGDNFARGQNGAKLEIKQQGIHYYPGLQSPSEMGDPLGSGYWIPNGDGTYRRENIWASYRYHPCTLYFMGLLTEENYDFNKKFELYDAGIGVNFNDQTAKFYKQVSINNIIAVAGKRSCVN